MVLPTFGIKLDFFDFFSQNLNIYLLRLKVNDTLKLQTNISDRCSYFIKKNLTI